MLGAMHTLSGEGERWVGEAEEGDSPVPRRAFQAGGGHGEEGGGGFVGQGGDLLGGVRWGGWCGVSCEVSSTSCLTPYFFLMWVRTCPSQDV